jgi:hypothetical protein
MSRIRSVKPEFWTSEQVLECSTNARLMFLGLWNFCDDAGRHPYSAKQVKAEVFPSDDFTAQDILGMLEELSTNGLIARYVSGGKEYFYVTGWKHQRIDKPQEPKYPDPFAEHSQIVPRTIPPDTIGEDRKGKDVIRAVADATRPTTNFYFLKFWEAYPRRKGSNPKGPAEKLFDAAVKSGVPPDAIVAAVRAGIGFDRDKIGTEYIPQAVKWLRDRRWQDDGAEVPSGNVPGFYAAFGSKQLDAWDKTKPGGYPRDKAGGWRFPSEWPPGHKQEAA